MRNKSLLNFILYIIWCIWFIMPILLSLLAGGMGFLMLFFPFIDDGNVSGYYLMIGGLLFFALLVILKIILVVFQFISIKKENPTTEMKMALIQLFLSIPLFFLIWLNQNELNFVLQGISPFFLFPILIELILIIVNGLDYLLSMAGYSNKIFIVNYFIPGLGTILMGTNKYRISSYFQIVLFFIFLTSIFTANVTFLIHVTIIWIWSFFNTKKLLNS